MLTPERADKPTFDCDTRQRCARRDLPVGIVNRHGALALVRSLDDLEAARPDLCNAPNAEGTN